MTLRHFAADVYDMDAPEPALVTQAFIYAETADLAWTDLSSEYPDMIVSEPIDVTFDPKDM